ncbi:hypothetical protein BsWGS_03063 [Bradybaena similaris]
MSLLVTSCTMGKQPDRLLNKGPQYLRTRTNAGMFGQHKKSAVELLAASKAQFYNIRASVSLDNYQDLAVSLGQHERYGQICSGSKLKESARSKSQYDLSVSRLSTADDENDENNKGSSDDSVSLSELDVFNSNSWWSPQDNVPVKQNINFEGTAGFASVTNFVKNYEDAPDSNSVAGLSENITVEASSPHPKLTFVRSASTTSHGLYENITVEASSPHPKLTFVRSSSTTSHGLYENITVEASSPQPKLTFVRSASTTSHGLYENVTVDVATPQRKLTFVRSASTTLPESKHIYENIAFVNKPAVSSNEINGTGVKKPVPLPRKSKEKPVPPPRRFSVKTPLSDTGTDLQLHLSKAVSSPVISHASLLTDKHSTHETPKVETPTLPKESTASERKKHSLVESLTKRFTALSAASTPLKSETHNHIHKEGKSTELKDTSAVTGTFTATPVYIGKTNACCPSFQAKRVLICPDNVDSCRATVADSECERSHLNSDHIIYNKGRKRCPDAPTSNRAVKKERRSLEISHFKPGYLNSFVSRFVPVRKSSSASTSKSEMSIESVDQAVCESDLKAIPSASMEADNLRDQDELAREVTRSNSSLSGKMESQDSLPHPASPTVHCALVPRSHSDIGCCLESQHSRDSSLVSSHSRLSRASVGADLEQFFNQMGLEKGVLEPVGRLRELQANEVFDSISSLDSHDAASICSTYSRSEQEWSDSQSVERNQQQTSIVERNARIIKWLCNVKKAKGQQPQKLEATAAGKI